MASREQDYISIARGLSKQLLDAYNGLKAMQPEATYLDYTNTLDDGTGENVGITKADVIAVVFTTTDAVGTLLSSGHGSNLAKLL